MPYDPKQIEEKWQRAWSEALSIIDQIKETLLKHRTRIP